MPNGTLDGFNHILDFDESLTDVFRISAILFLRQSSRDVAAVRNLSISCCDQLLNVFVILSHSGGLLLINLFAQQLRQLGDVRRDRPASLHFPRPLFLRRFFPFPFAGPRVVAGDTAPNHLVAPFVARHHERNEIAAAEAKRAERDYNENLQQQLAHGSSSYLGIIAPLTSDGGSIALAISRSLQQSFSPHRV
jgi:hypothetical protein